VDNTLPHINEKLFTSGGRYSFAEKAYAKLRYCYKGILGVGIQQVIFETTGKNSLRYTIDKDNQGNLDLLEKHLTKQDFIILLGEG